MEYSSVMEKGVFYTAGQRWEAYLVIEIEREKIFFPLLLNMGEKFFPGEIFYPFGEVEKNILPHFTSLKMK